MCFIHGLDIKQNHMGWNIGPNHLALLDIWWDLLHVKELSLIPKETDLSWMSSSDPLHQAKHQMSWLIILYCLPSLIINRQAFFHVKAQFHPKMIVLFWKCRKFILLLPSLIHIIKRWFVGVSCLSYTWRINNTLFSTSRKAIKNGASLYFFSSDSSNPDVLYTCSVLGKLVSRILIFRDICQKKLLMLRVNFSCSKIKLKPKMHKLGST